MDEKGQRDIVGYYSRTLTVAEINWSSYELEALGVLLTREKYFYLLQGRQFTLFNDNQAVASCGCRQFESLLRRYKDGVLVWPNMIMWRNIFRES